MNMKKIARSLLVCLLTLPLASVAVAGHRARLLNDAAVDRIMEVWPTLRSGLEASVPGVENVGHRVVMTTSPPWSYFKSVAKGEIPTPYQLGQAFKVYVKRVMLPKGVTQFESRLDTAAQVSAMYMLLREEGKLPIRFAWHYEQHRQPIFTDAHVRAFYTDRGVSWMRMKDGSPWLWLGGVGSEGDGDTVNGPCMQGFGELSDPRMENCSDVSSATTNAVLIGALQAGWRLVGFHGIGPGEVALVARYIDKAMEKNPDLTLERVRSMRNTFAHGTLLGHDPRLFEIARKYNFTLVVDPYRAFNDEPGFVKKYMGGDMTQIAPVKSVLDAGVHLAIEFGGFKELQAIVTRVNDRTGEVINPAEAVDRVVALKLVNIMSAHAMFSDAMTGSLEPGKYADFIVLDKDYLTGPDDEIHDNKVLQTFINGERVWQIGDTPPPTDTPPPVAKRTDVSTTG